MTSRVLGIHCPTCNAHPGDPCTRPTSTGRRNVTWFHDSRQIEAREARATFTLAVKLGGEVMRTGADVQRALSGLAVNCPKLGHLEEGGDASGSIVDEWGNTVGEWRFGA